MSFLCYYIKEKETIADLRYYFYSMTPLFFPLSNIYSYIETYDIKELYYLKKFLNWSSGRKNDTNLIGS